MDRQYNIYILMSTSAIVYIYAFYINDQVLNLWLYKYLGFIVSLKMEHNRRNVHESLYVKITCNIFDILWIPFVGSVAQKERMFLK
jgi:hypothetical protein